MSPISVDEKCNTHPGIAEALGLISCVDRASACLAVGGMLYLCWRGGHIQGGSLGKGLSDETGIPYAYLLRQLLGRWGLTLLEPDPAQNRLASDGFNAKGWSSSCFRRTDYQPRWRLTTLKEHDFEAFSKLFTRVFGPGMTFAMWRWKYAQGRGCALAAWRDGELVAHYGGNLRRVMAFGQPLLAWQICDAMVDPRERAVMTKRGAMFQVAATFLELFLGLAGIPLAFGFPNRRAMRLGERLGQYVEVGALYELRWAPLDKRPRFASRIRHLNPGSNADQDRVDQLWTAMQRDLAYGIVGVRDWEHLRYRYLFHPERHYELLLVSSRFSRNPLGLLILQREADAVALTDLVAPLRHIPALLVQARRLTRLWGKSSLYCWITRQHIGHFTTPDMKAMDIEVSIPTNAWVPQPFTPEQIRDRWWLTIGDTDFL